jgi:protocatechuate 3,4-dioxygenase beta subunit
MAASRMATAQTPATLLPLTAQTTEGPFYFDAGKVRQDITEGQPGVPVEVRFTVVDMHGRPLAGRRVDLWHCNASGVYSGYAGQVDDHASACPCGTAHSCAEASRWAPTAAVFAPSTRAGTPGAPRICI